MGDDKREGGVSKPQKLNDIIFGPSLSEYFVL